MSEANCAHCGQDLVKHYHRNLKCPIGETVYREAPIKSELSDLDILQSFDAQVWAKAFVQYVAVNPSIATDEATMISWFANALMRGYDEHYWRTKGYKRMVRRILFPWWNWKHWAFADWIVPRLLEVHATGH